MTLAANGSRIASPVPTAALPPRTSDAEFAANLPEYVRETLEALGHLLARTRPPEEPENAMRFAERHLGVRRDGRVGVEALSLTSLTAVTLGLAVAAAIDQYEADTGPYENPGHARWLTAPLAEDVDIRLPHALSAAFPAGTLHEVPAVIRFSGRAGLHGPEMDVTVAPRHAEAAREILEALRKRADELNPYRGRWALVSVRNGKLSFDVQRPPAIDRSELVASPEVWAALDEAAAAVSTGREALLQAGLGGRRGVLVAGDPGNGKTQLCRLIASELHREHGFSVLQVAARAGDSLTAVLEQANLLAPVVVLLDDVDLLGISNRTPAGGHGLHEVLSALDAHPDSAILCLATANTLRGLDAAAIRPGRFDALLTVSNPNRGDAEALLSAYLKGVPGGTEVDVAAVAAMLPTDARVSGAHLREAVRLAVLAGTPVSTVSLGAVVKSRRFRPEAPRHGGGGQYL